MRKLATIREIAEIKPIPDADRIEVARIDGWEVVVSKKDNFHVGDRVVYVEIDSKMPETPEYEFLKSRKYLESQVEALTQSNAELSNKLDAAYAQMKDMATATVQAGATVKVVSSDK